MYNFKHVRQNKWRLGIALLKTYRAYLSRNPLTRLDNLILFVGYPRSSHSLVGALLDAHPQVVVSHQTHLLDFLERGLAKERVLQLVLDNNAKFTSAGRQSAGYNYDVPGQWHGRHINPKYIGDKSGGVTARKLMEWGSCAKLDEIVDKTGVQLTFIHVIRNPFDSITTMSKKVAGRRNREVIEADLNKKTAAYFDRADGVDLLKAHGRYPVIDVYSEKLAIDTPGELTKLFDKLGLIPSSDYLRACDKLVWDKPSQSRNSISLWTEERKKAVSEKMGEYPWFSPYSFES